MSFRTTATNHPVLVGIGVTTLVWFLGIAAGVSSVDLAATTTDGVASVAVLTLLTAAFGVPGAIVTGYLAQSSTRVDGFIRGYGAAAGGGLLAITLVFVVFQAGRGVGPALEAGEPGAALFSLVAFGFVALALGVVVLLSSLVAAPFAIGGTLFRHRK